MGKESNSSKYCSTPSSSRERLLLHFRCIKRGGKILWHVLGMIRELKEIVKGKLR